MLHEAFGIRHGVMTTVHAYTGDQQLLDGPHKDYRARPQRRRSTSFRRRPAPRRRSASSSPSSLGKLQGFAVRVPVPTGSLVDLTVELEHETTAQAVNAAMRERADQGALAGILAYSEEPLVSTDIVKSPYSSIFDAGLTIVIGGTQVKVVAWYDNEWGYSSRLVDLAQRVLVPVRRLRGREKPRHSAQTSTDGATARRARAWRTMPPVLSAIELTKRFGDDHGRERPVVRRRGRQRHRLPRPERRRQDDDAADAARAGRAHLRPRAGLRPPLRRSRPAGDARRRRARSRRPAPRAHGRDHLASSPALRACRRAGCEEVLALVDLGRCRRSPRGRLLARHAPAPRRSRPRCSAIPSS